MTHNGRKAGVAYRLLASRLAHMGYRLSIVYWLATVALIATMLSGCTSSHDQPHLYRRSFTIGECEKHREAMDTAASSEAACLVDSDCRDRACGLFCQQDVGRCRYDCYSADDCPQDHQCDDSGRCQSEDGQAIAQTQDFTLAVETSRLVLPEGGASEQLIIAIASKDERLVQDASKHPRLLITATSGLSIQCGDGDPSQFCELRPTYGENKWNTPYAFEAEGAGYRAEIAIGVAPQQSLAITDESITITTDHLDSGMLVAVTSDRSNNLMGSYIGTLSRELADGISLQVPVTAYVTDAGLIIDDTSHALAESGRIRLGAEGEIQQARYLSAAAGATAGALNLRLLTLYLDYDQDAGILFGEFSAVTGLFEHIWRFSLMRAGPATACTEDRDCAHPDCDDQNGTCAPPTYCDDLLDICVAGAKPAAIIEDSVLIDDRIRKARNDALLARSSGQYVHTDADVDLAEEIVCYRDSSSTGSRLAGARTCRSDAECIDDVLPESKDRPCENGGSPVAVPLIHGPDLGEQEASERAPFSLVRDCLAELDGRPAESGAAPRCINRDRLLPALALALDRAPWSRRAAALTMRFFQQWLEVHEFVARHGLEDRKLASIFDQHERVRDVDESDWRNTPTLEHLLSALESSWDLLLDASVQETFNLLPPGFWHRPDYRRARRAPIFRADRAIPAGPIGVSPRALDGDFTISLGFTLSRTAPSSTAPNPVPLPLVSDGADNAITLELMAVRPQVRRTYRLSLLLGARADFELVVPEGRFFGPQDIETEVSIVVDRQDSTVRLVTADGVSQKVELDGSPGRWEGDLRLGRDRYGAWFDGSLKAVAIYDQALATADAARAIDLEWQQGTPPPGEMEVGLPVTAIDTVAAHLDLAAAYVARAQRFDLERCRAGKPSPIRGQAVARAGRALRVATLIEGMAERFSEASLAACRVESDCAEWAATCGFEGACERDGGPVLVEPAWRKHLVTARKTLASSQARLADELSKLAACENDLDIALDDLPLFVTGDAGGERDRYFAMTRNIIARAGNLSEDSATGLLAESEQALQRAREAWLQRRDESYASLVRQSDSEHRAQEIRTQRNLELAELCGRTASTDLLKDFDEGRERGTTCFIAKTNRCRSNAREPARNADPACYHGEIGGHWLALQGAEEAANAALVAAQAAENQYALAMQHCAERQSFDEETLGKMKEHHARMRELRKKQRTAGGLAGFAGSILGAIRGAQDAAGFLGQLQGVASGASFAHPGMAAAGAGLSFLGSAAGQAQAGYEEDLKREQEAFEGYMQGRANERDFLVCRQDAKMHLAAIETADAQKDVAEQNAVQALAAIKRAVESADRIALAGQAEVEREVQRAAGQRRAIHHYFFDERVSEFEYVFERARRYTFVALLSARYELQLAFEGLEAKILAAAHPADLDDALDQIQDAIKDAPHGEAQIAVASLGRDVLGIDDPAKFGELLASPASAIYIEGQYVGQGIRFTLMPGIGQEELRNAFGAACGERLWTVHVRVTTSSSVTVRPKVQLFQRNVFFDRVCHATDSTRSGQLRERSVRPSVSLFGPSDETQSDMRRALYSRTEIQAVTTVDEGNGFRRAPQFPGGSSAFAGRGLLGDYILLVPKDSPVSPGQIRELELRFDFLARTQPGSPDQAGRSDAGQ
jgi:hypothetical protein